MRAMSQVQVEPGGTARLDRAVAIARRRLMALALARLAAVAMCVAALGALGYACFFAAVTWAGAALVVAVVWLVAMAVAWRRRPTRRAVVAYLDARLAADGLLVTVDDAEARTMRWSDARRRDAEQLLAERPIQHVLPRVAGSTVLQGALGVALCLSAALVPHDEDATGAAGADGARVDVAALRRIERLPALVRDDGARRELERARREAIALRRQLAAGVGDPRDALAKLHDVREAVARGRAAEARAHAPARGAAAEALAGEAEMAAAVMRDDLEGLTGAVERAAARREAADRARAREALERAERAADEHGDGLLARSLEARRSLLERRAAQAELARELLEAMPEFADGAVRRGLERLERDGDGVELERAVVEAMREAWQRLSADERRRLADAMQRAAVAPSDRRAAEEGPPRAGASTPRTADELEAEFRRALADLSRVQRAVDGSGSNGLPMPGAGGSRAASSAAAAGAAGRAPGSGGPGGGGGASAGRTSGESERVNARDGVLARVRPSLGGGAPSQTVFDRVRSESTTSPPRAVESLDAVRGAAPAAVERQAIPDDYREHVRRYFGGLDEEDR